MIEEIQISNVRLFDGSEEWRIPVSPLSVFCGTNSSGKSTILKSLLLLCQTHSLTDIGQQGGRLRFTGALVDLGSYRSFVSHNQVDRDVVLGVAVRNTVESRDVGHLQQLRGETPPPADPSVEQEYVLNARFRCGVLSAGGPDAKLDPDDVSISVEKTSSSQAFLKEAVFDFQSESGARLSWKIVLSSKPDEYDILIPVDYFGAVRGFDFMEVPKDDVGGQVRIETFMRGLIPAGLWAAPKARKGKDSEGSTGSSFFPLPPLIRHCCDRLFAELTEVHYLGPLRSPAKRYYMTNLDVVPALDTAGEFLPYVLRDQRDHPVLYVPPGPKATLTSSTLKRALDSWMFYLRTGHYLTADEHGRLA